MRAILLLLALVVCFSCVEAGSRRGRAQGGGGKGGGVAPIVSCRQPDVTNVIISEDESEITVQGSGFTTDSVVVIAIRGVLTPLPTDFVSSNELIAELPDLEPGSYQLQVFNSPITSWSAASTKSKAAGRGGKEQPEKVVCISEAFEFTLGVQGPPGPEGPEGPQGPDGDDGECPTECPSEDCQCDDEDDCKCDTCECPAGDCACDIEDCTCDVTDLCTLFVSTSRASGLEGDPDLGVGFDCAPISGVATDNAVAAAQCIRSRVVVTEECVAQNFRFCFTNTGSGGVDISAFLDVTDDPNDLGSVSDDDEFVCTAFGVGEDPDEPICCDSTADTLITIDENSFPAFVVERLGATPSGELVHTFFSFECCPPEDP
jgi:hypothetical protein